jgi:hypothetical protein
LPPWCKNTVNEFRNMKREPFTCNSCADSMLIFIYPHYPSFSKYSMSVRIANSKQRRQWIACQKLFVLIWEGPTVLQIFLIIHYERLYSSA